MASKNREELVCFRVYLWFSGYLSLWVLSWGRVLEFRGVKYEELEGLQIAFRASFWVYEAGFGWVFKGFKD